jgi:hypothetical protein
MRSWESSADAAAVRAFGQSAVYRRNFSKLAGLPTMYLTVC